MNFWVQYILVAIAVTLADVCWTMYFIETANKQAVRAGVWSAMIGICSSYATVSFVEDKRFITATMIGAFLGTFITIKLVKRKEDQTAVAETPKTANNVVELRRASCDD